MNFNPASTIIMLHPKTKDRCAIIIPNFFLLGIETYSLGDVFVACKAPDIEGSFKTDSEGTGGFEL